MRYTGKEILENNELSDFLINSTCRVVELKSYDGSITKGYGRDIQFDIINNQICIYEGLWSIPIIDTMKFLVEIPNSALYNVFTLNEAAAIWGKDESSVRKSLKKLRINYDYRKAGRITFISKESMIKLYGVPSLK